MNRTPARKKSDIPIKPKNSAALFISSSGGRDIVLSVDNFLIHELKSDINVGFARKMIPTIKRKTPKETRPE
jgi:hypothetical protein